MPPEAYLPGSPADWLRHAHSDLELARGVNLAEAVVHWAKEFVLSSSWCQ